jgi:hypothetical protein
LINSIAASVSLLWSESSSRGSAPVAITMKC